MALQYVGGTTATFAGSTSGTNTVSLTALTGGIASAPAAGDIVIVAYATGSAAQRALSVTGYTEVTAQLYVNGSSVDTNLEVCYKVLTAADTSLSASNTGNNLDAGAIAVHVWRGADPVNPFDVTPTTATGTTSGRPNGAAITPVSTGAVVIVAGAAAAATGAVFTTTDLSNFRTATSADTNDAMVGIGSFAWTSGSFDPAAWGGGTTGGTDTWAAVTLAIKPPDGFVSVTPGSYSITGSSVQLENDARLEATPGAYSLTGSDAATFPQYAVITTPGSYSIAGVDGELTYYPGNTYNYVRWDAVNWDDFFWDEIRTIVTPDGLGIAGFSAELIKSVPVAAVLETTPGGYALTGASSATLLGLTATVTPGSYSLTGVSAEQLTSFLSTTTPGSYSIGGASAATLLKVIMTTDAGSYSLTGVAASQNLGTAIGVTPGSYSLTGSSATELGAFVAQATAGALVVTGSSASMLVGFQTQTSPGSLAITGQAATTLAKLVDAAQPGALTITGSSASLLLSLTAVTTPGGYAVAGSAADLAKVQSNTIATIPGVYSVSGLDAAVLYSGAGEGTSYRGFIVNMGRMMATSSGVASAAPDLANLLTEDGGGLLLEDGGQILLE